jgi:hypothetical protein
VGIGQYGDRLLFQEEHAMKKNVVVAVIAVVLVLAVAWAAFGQAAGGGGGQRGAAQREAQMKALASIQENVAKLKSMMEAQAKAMEGRSFADMSEEERTKMREESTKRREEQQKVMAAMQQQMDTLKGGRQLAVEHQQAMTPLKEALASAQKENAKQTTGMLEKLIADRQKQFEEKMAAMGITPDQLERMMQMPAGGQGGQGGQRGQRKQ